MYNEVVALCQTVYNSERENVLQNMRNRLLTQRDEKDGKKLGEKYKSL